MSREREVFERRLEAAVRGYVEAAPTEIDAARLTHSLATNVPRVRRLVRVPVWRLPSLGFAWILVVAALLAVAGVGLLASGALRDVHLLPTPPTPSQTLETPPAVIASPVATTPAPSPAASPSTSPPIGIVLPSSWVQDQARFQDALKTAGYGAQILFSRDSATEKAAVETLIGRGIKVLILCPQDGAAAAAAADEARAAGVKVINYGRLVLDTASVDYYVDFDNVAVGAAQAQYLIDRAGATTGTNLYLYAGAGLDDPLLECVLGADRVRFVGRRLAEHPAEVDEVFLGRGLLRGRDAAPLRRERRGRQARLGRHAPLPRWST
jgi:ABC-type sugar transport system substrate-binding protein